MEHSHKLEKLQLRVEAGIRSTKPLQEALEPKQMLCPDHGEYTSTGARYMGSREIWSRCPDCHERMVADERKAEAEKQAKIAQLRLEQQLEQAAIPARFLSRNFDNFTAASDNQAKALEIVKTYAANFEKHSAKGEGLVLSGLPGTGKSHLGAAMVNHVINSSATPARMHSSQEIIRMLRATWNRDKPAAPLAWEDGHGYHEEPAKIGRAHV